MNIKFKNKKKGFTIVELVIVIAIIGILSAILIPTFANLINKANISSDQSLVKNLNTALAMDNAENGKYETVHKTFESLDKNYGYDVATIVTKSNGELVYDSTNNQFVLDLGNGEYFPEASYKEEELYKLWKIYTDDNEITSGTYSIYLANENYSGDVNVSAGFDAGNNTNITTVSYVNKSGTKQNVTIRTNGGTLNIDAPLDTVYHYGNADVVTLKDVANTDCYHEYGTVGFASIESGKFILSTGKVYGLHILNSNAIIEITANTTPTITKETGITANITFNGSTYAGSVQEMTAEAAKKMAEQLYSSSDPTLITGIKINGIAGFENQLFATPEDAYDAINPVLSENGGLEQDGLDEETFKSIYTSTVYNNGVASGVSITWTIYGEQTFSNTLDTYFLSFGRKAAWYGSNEKCIREINIVGGNNNAKLNIETSFTMPYQWWGETTNDLINFNVQNIIINSFGKIINVNSNFRSNFNMSFERCTFNQKLYVYYEGKSTINIDQCIFEGANNESYALHLQGKENPITLNFTNNIVKDSARGINIDQATCIATITGNRFENLLNESNSYAGAIQITQCSSISISNNSFSDIHGDVFKFYKNLSGDVTIKNNTIKDCDYLLWNDNTESKFNLDASDNIISNTNTSQSKTKTEVVDSNITINNDGIWTI